MRTRTTRTRRLAAAATRAAVRTAGGALPVDPVPAATDTAGARSIVERPDRPRRLFVSGRPSLCRGDGRTRAHRITRALQRDHAAEPAPTGGARGRRGTTNLRGAQPRRGPEPAVETGRIEASNTRHGVA